MSNLFNPAHKVASRLEGTMWKWNDWKVGAQFGGTYLGNHTWTSKDGKEVVAYDFADCTINGEKKPENEVHTFNQSYILDEIMESVKPGQRMGIEYAGQAPPKNGKQGVRLFTPYIDPNNVDADYRRFLGGKPLDQKEKFLGTDAEETAPTEDTASQAQPFHSMKDIMAIAAGKLGVTDEAGAKVAIKAITGLDVTDANVEAIMTKLKTQFGA